MSQQAHPGTNGGGQRNGDGGRTIQELEADLMTMWTLVNDLGAQLTSNRALAETLKARAGEVKGQAVHTGSGFPLRRYNVDISDEQFTTELEKFASHLVLENQNLQYENKQLSLLLKDCEGTLEGVMARFRSVSHAATQHELALHSYYTSMIAELQTSHSSATLLDSTNLSILLTRLSELIRAALRSVNGEDTTQEDEELLPHDARVAVGTDPNLPDNLRGMLNELEEAGKSLQDTANRDEGPASLTFDGTKPLPMRGEDWNGLFHERGGHATQSGKAVGMPPRDRARQSETGLPSTIGRWMGDAGKSGGYYGTEGRADWALEREGEISRLEEENQMLRKLLGVDLELISMEERSEESEQDDVAIAAAREEGRRQSEEIQAMRESATYLETVGSPPGGHLSPIAPKRTFAQSTAEVPSTFHRSPRLGTSPKSSTSWREERRTEEQNADPEKIAAMGSTAHVEDVPLEDVIFSSPEEEGSPPAPHSPPRNRSATQVTSPKFTAPPSPMMATSPTFTRSQTTPSLSRSPKASISRVSMLSPTNIKTSLPTLGSPQGSAIIRGAAGIDGGLGSPNPLASIFVKPKTDATTATTTSADPTFDLGEITTSKDSGSASLASRTISSPVVGLSALGLGFSSIPSPLASAATATAQEDKQRSDSPGTEPKADESKDGLASQGDDEPTTSRTELM